MKFTGQELEQLQQALLNAFSLETLKQMFRFKLEKDLDAITTANGFNNIVFDLISIANKEGWLIQLIIVAKDYNPNNKVFNAVATTLLNKSKTTLNQPNPNNEPLPTSQTYKNQQPPNLDRSILFKQLTALVPGQFNQLLFEINPPPGLIPPIPAAQADRVYVLLEWAKSPTGCGLSKIQEILEASLTPLASVSTLPKQTIPEITFNSPKIIDIGVNELKDLIPKIEILLLTVNDWERKALLSEMTPLDGKDGILQGALDRLTYRIGMFGNYCAAYTESTMGSGGRHGATLTTKTAVDELKPKAVLLLGIAFGIDSNKQKLGDVLIAESIQPYEFQKVNNDFSITYCGQAAPCGNILSERFRMRRSDWTPKHGDKSFDDVKVHQGLVLSGEKVVNNKDFRDALVKAFPTSIGGEMEGAGAYSAVSSPVEVILIKSICDWADGEKNDLAQPFAAFTAVSLAKHVLTKPDVLHPLIDSQSNTQPNNQTQNIDHNNTANNQLITADDNSSVSGVIQVAGSVNNSPITIHIRNKKNTPTSNTNQTAIDNLPESNPFFTGSKDKFIPEYSMGFVLKPTSHVLEAYLKWLIKQHGNLDTPLRLEGRLPQIPLDKVFVALRGDLASSYERNQSHAWLEKMVSEFETNINTGELSSEERHNVRWRILARSPLTPYLEERNRLIFEQELPSERINLGEAFQKERQLVILGDPGSGKTTLARWLIQKLASAFLEGNNEVVVPAIQINPEAEETDPPINLGPVRLPVLLRVSEFAEYRKTHEKSISLAEFLGHHTWGGSTAAYLKEHPDYGKSVHGQELNKLILSYLKQDSAIIILDGLDEITALNQRDEIITAIEQFIWQFVGQRKTISLQEKPSKVKSLVDLDKPISSGGNQILITSRITGYYAAYLKGDITHVTIEPMSDKAVSRFCDAWVKEIYLASNHTEESIVSIEKRAKEEAQGLKTELLESDRRGVRDLASNPFLITVLAAIYHTSRRQLPEQRAALYQLAVENLSQVWERRDTNLINKDEMIIQVIAPLAAYIQDHYPTGLITKQEIIGKKVEEYLATYWHENPKKILPSLKEEAKNFLRSLGEDIGLLAARGKDLYGFLHLTFQEYLAGLSLIQNEETAASKLLTKISDPRWHEPLLLALGHAKLTWAEETFQQVLVAMLKTDEQLDNLTPNCTFLIVAALPEIREFPNIVIKEVTLRLLQIYADRNGLGQFKPLQKQVEQAFVQLKESKNTLIVEQILQEVITSPHTELALAAAILIHKNAWLSVGLIRALLKALPNDRADWEWPIHKAMASFVTYLTFNSPFSSTIPLSPESVSERGWLSPEMKDVLSQFQPDHKHNSSRFTKHNKIDISTTCSRAISRELPFRYALEQNASLVEFILNDPMWLRLVTALYGGIGNYNTAETLDEYIRINQQIQFGGMDAGMYRELAIRLDTEVQPTLKQLQELKPTFEVKHIYKDSPLTIHILPVLERRLPTTNILKLLWNLLQESKDIVLQAEAFVALAVLEENIATLLPTTATESKSEPFINLALARLSYIADTLRDAVTRTHKYIPDLFKEITPLSAEQQMRAIAAAIEVAVINGSQPITTITLLDKFSAPEKTYLLAEFWSFMLSGGNSDAVYNMAVVLDTTGNELLSSPEILIKAFVDGYTARNNLWPYHLNCFFEKLPSYITNQPELIAEAITVFCNIPNEFAFVRGALLGSLKPLLTTEYTYLMPEALTIVLTTLSDTDGFNSQTDALTKLAPYLLNHPNPLQEVLNAAKTIAEPYYQSRALQRLASCFPEQHNQLLDEAMAAAKNIKTYYHKTRALELLLPSFLESRLQLLDEIWTTANHIEDNNNKARALTRISMYFPTDQRIKCLKQALDAVELVAHPKNINVQGASYYIKRLKEFLISPSENISNTKSSSMESAIFGERQLAETLKLLKPYLITYPNLFKRWENIVAQIKNAWYQDLAYNRLAPPLLKYQTSLDKIPTDATCTWAVLSLAAITKDLLDRATKQQSLEQLWTTLANTQSQQALQSLYDKGVSNGLNLTQTAANAIDTLIFREAWSEVYLLLPLLQKPDPEVLPLIYSWLANNKTTKQAAILLAETKGLTPQVIPELMELIANSNDRLRHRAAIILHGKDKDAHSIFSALELGQETIETLTRESIKYRELSPRKALVIRWCFEKIVFDAPQMITRWVERLTTGLEGSEVAEYILKNIQRITQQAWQVFYHQLQHGQPCVQRCLLESLIRLQIQQWSVSAGWQLSEEEFTALKVRLHKLCLHSSEDVRSFAIKAIGYLGKDDTDITTLKDIIHTVPKMDAGLALIAIGRIVGELIKKIKRKFGNVIVQQVTKSEKTQQSTNKLKEELEELNTQLHKAETWRNILLPYLKDDHILVARAATEALVRSQMDIEYIFEHLEKNKERMLLALLDTCNSWYMSDEARQAVQNAALFVERHPKLLKLLVQRLAENLTKNIKDTPTNNYDRSILLDVTAAATVRMPASFANIANEIGLQSLLIEAVEHHNTFPGRRAAITLLSFLRKVSSDVAIVLRSALHDVYDVQNGALQAAVRFTNIEDDFLSLLCKWLTNDDSALVAYVTAQILTVIGRNEKTPSKQKFYILSALRKAINNPSSHRPVYIMGGSGASGVDAFHVKHIGRLDQLFYQAFIQITGMDSLQINKGSTPKIEAHTQAKRYTVPCNLGMDKASTQVYLGKISAKDSPVQYQSLWFSNKKDGNIPTKVMDTLDKLRDIANENNLLFTELVDCAIEASKININNE